MATFNSRPRGFFYKRYVLYKLTFTNLLTYLSINPKCTQVLIRRPKRPTCDHFEQHRLQKNVSVYSWSVCTFEHFFQTWWRNVLQHCTIVHHAVKTATGIIIMYAYLATPCSVQRRCLIFPIYTVIMSCERNDESPRKVTTGE